MSVIRHTSLPGVGDQYDVATAEGRRLSVVVRLDGRRFIGIADPDDPDSCTASVTLGPEEAAALAEALTETRDDGPAEAEADGPGLPVELVTERIPITPDSPYSGRLLGDTKVRTRTGASIVAVLRRTGPIPSPAPDFRLATGDTLVVVGTREGVDAVSTIIAGE